jgi:NADPH2:quinone reductase
MHLGSHAEFAVVPAWKLVPIPASVSSEDAAAAMLQGMTAHYLTRNAYRIAEGDIVLVHAGAGGVGLLLIQMAKRCGATVLTTVSSEEKASFAKEAGADHVILYTKSDFAVEVQKLTAGHGVHAVYDSVGKETFERSLDCLRPRGYLVLFGQSSGPVPPMDLGRLASKGSLFITRPSLLHYMATREELLQRAGDLFCWIAEGELKLRIERVFPLVEAAQAQRLLESRKTAGKMLLVP